MFVQLVACSDTYKRAFRVSSSDFFNTVEAFRKVNRIAYSHLVRVHLIGPDLEVSHLYYAVNRRKCTVHCIETMGDLYSADSGFVVTRIKDMPSTTEINFAVGVKIHRRA